eukprot:scaffold165925_cov49-Tisochrysis_lutea.AAC.1
MGASGPLPPSQTPLWVGLPQPSSAPLPSGFWQGLSTQHSTLNTQQNNPDSSGRATRDALIRHSPTLAPNRIDSPLHHVASR